MFEMPAINVTSLDVTDIITTSPGGGISGDDQFGGGDEE